MVHYTGALLLCFPPGRHQTFKGELTFPGAARWRQHLERGGVGVRQPARRSLLQRSAANETPVDGDNLRSALALRSLHVYIVASLCVETGRSPSDASMSPDALYCVFSFCKDK